MPETMSSAAFFILLLAATISLGVLFLLFERHIAGNRLLEYEPRQRVPWGLSVVLLVMILTFAGVFFTLAGAGKANHHSSEDESSSQSEELSQSEGEVEGASTVDVAAAPEQPEISVANFVLNSLGTSTFLLLLVLALAVWLNVSVGASASDLGLPASSEQAVNDIKIGAIACAASLLPIYMLQMALTIVLEPKVEHPIIEVLRENHSPAILLSSLLLVVVAAPVSEEFFFRLLLQGWLERWEDKRIGYAGSDRRFAVLPMERVEEVGQASEESPVPSETSHVSLHETLDSIAPSDSPEYQGEEVLVFPAEPPPLPRLGVFTALPHGWLPILVSGSLFGLAHLGQGVSPVPLVLFGIVLGYLYQRTHRLLPSVTAHALFNAYSMVMLWLQLE